MVIPTYIWPWQDEETELDIEIKIWKFVFISKSSHQKHWCGIHFTDNTRVNLLELQTHQISVRNIFIFLQLQVCQFCFHSWFICTMRTEKSKYFFTAAHLLVMWKLPDWGTASGRNVPTMYYIIIMDFLCISCYTWWAASSQWMIK